MMPTALIILAILWVLAMLGALYAAFRVFRMYRKDCAEARLEYEAYRQAQREAEQYRQDTGDPRRVPVRTIWID